MFSAAFDLPEMSRLSPYDRMTLIQQNFKLILGFQYAWAYSSQVRMYSTT
jgi:hypothetical protein